MVDIYCGRYGAGRVLFGKAVLENNHQSVSGGFVYIAARAMDKVHETGEDSFNHIGNLSSADLLA